jgi:hypothetical protein
MMNNERHIGFDWRIDHEKTLLPGRCTFDADEYSGVF